MNPDDAPQTPSWRPLSPGQRRVLGVLIEKAKTTPAGYPMSINAVVLGCNQKHNRHPPMRLDADEVERILEELRMLGAVAEADESTRVAKFRHRAYEWLGVTRAELAVVAELLLRGAQTLGELRGRAARMEPIADLAALTPIVGALIERGLVFALTAPGRGQIVSHRLHEEPELAGLRAQFAGHDVPAAPGEVDRVATRPAATGTAPGPSPPSVSEDVLSQPPRAIAELRSEVATLQERVRALERVIEDGRKPQ